MLTTEQVLERVGRQYDDLIERELLDVEDVLRSRGTTRIEDELERRRAEAAEHKIWLLARLRMVVEYDLDSLGFH